MKKLATTAGFSACQWSGIWPCGIKFTQVQERKDNIKLHCVIFLLLSYYSTHLTIPSSVITPWRWCRMVTYVVMRSSHKAPNSTVLNAKFLFSLLTKIHHLPIILTIMSFNNASYLVTRCMVQWTQFQFSMRFDHHHRRLVLSPLCLPFRSLPFTDKAICNCFYSSSGFPIHHVHLLGSSCPQLFWYILSFFYSLQ